MSFLSIFLRLILISNLQILIFQCYLVTSQIVPPIPKIQFYSESDCKGNLIREDQGNTGFPLDQYRFASYNLTELWLIQPCNSTNKPDCNIPVPRNGVGLCINGNWSPPSHSHLHLTRLSDDLVQNKINFYSQPRLSGIHDSLTNDQNRKNLTFQALFFTGNYSWTTYEEAEFSGQSYCILRNDDVKEQGFGATFIIELGSMTMGSLRQGCHSDNILLPIEPRPTTTTESPDNDGHVILMSKTLICLLIVFRIVFLRL